MNCSLLLTITLQGMDGSPRRGHLEIKAGYTNCPGYNKKEAELRFEPRKYNSKGRQKQNPIYIYYGFRQRSVFY